MVILYVGAPDWQLRPKDSGQEPNIDKKGTEGALCAVNVMIIIKLIHLAFNFDLKFQMF